MSARRPAGVAGVIVAALALVAAAWTPVPPAAASTSTAPVLRAFGDASPPGSVPSLEPARVVGAAASSGGGTWLAADDGAVVPVDGAPALGPADAQRLHRPVVGIAATPTGRGYWLVADDGGVFSYGDAAFAGSTGAIRLNRPIVGMAPTPTGRGYWLVADDGGVFAFGDAPFLGSTGDLRLRRPITAVAVDPTGRGYWLIAADGGVFAFGDAPFEGSTGDLAIARPIAAAATTPTGRGYWLLGTDGGLYAFGDAVFAGSAAGDLPPGFVAHAILPTPTGQGYRILEVPRHVRAAFGGDVHGVSRVASTLAAGVNPLAPMATELAAADVRAVNLETAVGSAGTAQSKQYVFHSPPSLLDALAASGIDVVTLANNHAMDFGPAGLLETISLARARGLLVVGAGPDAASAYAPAVVATPGGTVAFVGLSQVVPAGWAATAGGAGVASAYDTGAVHAALARARQEADVVVVLIHWGIERSGCPSPTQRATAADLVRAGADLVVGSHPHVLQGVQALGGGSVAYSLGNFVWYGPGPTALLQADVGASDIALSFVPAQIDGAGRPVPTGGASPAPPAC